MQGCATPVIRFVDCGLFGLGSIAEGGDWDFGCQSECCSEEFLVEILASEYLKKIEEVAIHLAILTVAERSAGVVWRNVNGVLDLAAVAAPFVNGHCRC